MSKIEDGGAAFPSVRKEMRNYWGGKPSMAHFEEVREMEVCERGATLRDYFAAKALTNLYTQCEGSPDKAAEWAYQLADAMIRARAAGGEQS